MLYRDKAVLLAIQIEREQKKFQVSLYKDKEFVQLKKIRNKINRLEMSKRKLSLQMTAA